MSSTSNSINGSGNGSGGAAQATDDPGTIAFARGDLPAAIAAAVARVKAAPRDSGLRWLLAELQLIAGDTERADRALDAVIADEPGPAVLEFRRVLRAAELRAQTLRDGRVPKFQGDDPTPAQRAAMRALTLARAGDLAGAAAAAAEAEAERPRVSGVANGTPFDDFRDADDLFAPQIEVLTSGGEYMWIPTERIASLSFEPVRRPRDLVLRRTELSMKDGQDGLVFLPATYGWSGLISDALKLGRETSWSDGEGPVRGSGQRLFLIGEDAVAANDLSTIEFS